MTKVQVFNNFIYPKMTLNHNMSQVQLLKKNELSNEYNQLIELNFPWLENKTLKKALAEIVDINFDTNDFNYIKSNGIIPPFSSGKEVLHFLSYSNVRIDFGEMSDVQAHAQYNFHKNTIFINKQYKNTINKAEILAIAEAILHEAGHAKDYEGNSSIQEELECLSINAMAHRFLQKKYPNIFAKENSPIIKDGVSIYAKLFFDKNINALKARVAEKYGDLKTGDYLHPASQIAKDIKSYYQKHFS